MLSIVYTNRMKRDVKHMKRRGKDMEKLTVALDLLASGESMPEKYKDHSLRGELQGYRECHIEPDWLLIYRIIQDELILLAAGTGTHFDLFDE